MVFLVHHDEGEVGSGCEDGRPASTGQDMTGGHLQPRARPPGIILAAVDAHEGRLQGREAIQDVRPVPDLGYEHYRCPRWNRADELGDQLPAVLSRQGLYAPCPRRAGSERGYEECTTLVRGQSLRRHGDTRLAGWFRDDADARRNEPAERAPPRRHVAARNGSHDSVHRRGGQGHVDDDTFHILELPFGGSNLQPEDECPDYAAPERHAHQRADRDPVGQLVRNEVVEGPVDTPRRDERQDGRDGSSG